MCRIPRFLVVVALVAGVALSACSAGGWMPAVPAPPTAAYQPAQLPSSTLPGERPTNVVLIGWDGAQRNHIKEMMASGQLPNLQRLTSEGSIVAIDITRTTDTKAGWTQILTGYEPEVTGVFSNGRYQPIPAGYTVFERLEKSFGKDNIATVAVIGKSGHIDADPPGKERLKAGEVAGAYDTIVTENGIRYRLTPGKPYYYAKDGLDVWINGLMLDNVVGPRALELLDIYSGKRFFFFVHFAEIDHKGHASGENSPEVDGAYRSADTWTGRLMDRLKELKLYDSTSIYVTADHGFDEGTKNHADAPYVFLGTNDKQVMRRGVRADITPTILDRFGVDLNSLTPPLDGHSLAKPYQPPKW